MENKFLKAKELFDSFDGSKYEMMREDVVKEYLSYNVPKEVECQWIDDLFFEKYNQLNINDNNSLISMAAFIVIHSKYLCNKLHLIEVYIATNYHNDLNKKGTEILIDTILEQLYKMNKDVETNKNIDKEITRFQSLKQRIFLFPQSKIRKGG
jgi:hypothetical protein